MEIWSIILIDAVEVFSKNDQQFLQDCPNYLQADEWGRDCVVGTDDLKKITKKNSSKIIW